MEKKETDQGTNQDVSPKFAVGDRVKRDAFVNCFDDQVEAIPGLVVESVTLIRDSLPAPLSRFAMRPYFRVLARGVRGGVEAAERFFSKED